MSRNRRKAQGAPSVPLTLYHMPGCPYCVKTRKSIKPLKLKIQLKDTYQNPRYRQELTKGGGKHQVPCLRIAHSNGKIQWLYESRDIVRFLDSYQA